MESAAQYTPYQGNAAELRAVANIPSTLSALINARRRFLFMMEAGFGLFWGQTANNHLPPIYRVIVRRH